MDVIGIQPVPVDIHGASKKPTRKSWMKLIVGDLKLSIS